MRRKMTGIEYAGNSRFLKKLNSGYCALNLHAFQTSEISYLPMLGAPACVTDVL